MTNDIEVRIISLIDNIMIKCNPKLYAKPGITKYSFNINEYNIKSILYVDSLAIRLYEVHINNKPLFEIFKRSNKIESTWYVEGNFKNYIVEKLIEVMVNKIKKHEIKLSDVNDHNHRSLWTIITSYIKRIYIKGYKK